MKTGTPACADTHHALAVGELSCRPDGGGGAGSRQSTVSEKGDRRCLLDPEQKKIVHLDGYNTG